MATVSTQVANLRPFDELARMSAVQVGPTATPRDIVAANEFYLPRQRWGIIFEDGTFHYSSFDVPFTTEGSRFGTVARWTPPGETIWDDGNETIGVRRVGNALEWVQKPDSIDTTASSVNSGSYTTVTITGATLYNDDAFYRAYDLDLTITFNRLVYLTNSDITVAGVDLDTSATETLSASVSPASLDSTYTITISTPSFGSSTVGEQLTLSFGPLFDSLLKPITPSGIPDYEFVYRAFSGTPPTPVLSDLGATGGGHKFFIDFKVPAGLSVIGATNKYYDQYFPTYTYWNSGSGYDFVRGIYNGSYLPFGVDVSNIEPVSTSSYVITIPMPVKSNGAVVGTPTTLEVWVDSWPSGLPASPAIQTPIGTGIPPDSNHVTI